LTPISDSIFMAVTIPHAFTLEAASCIRGRRSQSGETLTTSILTQNPTPLIACRGDLVGPLDAFPIKESFDRRLRKSFLLLFAVTALAILAGSTMAQSIVPSDDSAAGAGSTTRAIPGLEYERPTERTMASNFVFDAFGPYPIAGSAFAAGLNQLSDSPPEWRQGAEGYFKRFGSDLGIVGVGTTTRYGLAEAFREDTLYYRCECRGVFPRLRHAVLSTLTARRGDDGHRVFSFPALVAPYAGSMTAIYGWYPSRFSAMDGFRIGNYGLLSYLGENVALEFFYSGPHSLLSRMHLNNTHGAPAPGPNH
jgi:hypothetical protein